MRYRIDFGRIFPGLVLFLVGLALLCLLALGVVILYFFSFLAGAAGATAFILELMIVPALMIAVGVITIITGVSWWGKGGVGWMAGIAKARARADRLRLSARVGEVIGVLITAVIFLFVYENQLRGVAFFTSGFGLTAQFLFYAPLFTGMALSLARAFYGRRNGVRPFDSLNSLFLAIAAFWLLSVFPFDFTHFGDLFPTGMQFIFSWLSNDIGRFLFTLAGLASSINFVYTAFLYSSVRGQLMMARSPLQ